jgi:hypothetical protein
VDTRFWAAAMMTARGQGDQQKAIGVTMQLLAARGASIREKLHVVAVHYTTYCKCEEGAGTLGTFDPLGRAAWPR